MHSYIYEYKTSLSNNIVAIERTSLESLTMSAFLELITE